SASSRWTRGRATTCGWAGARTDVRSSTRTGSWSISRLRQSLLAQLVQGLRTLLESLETHPGQHPRGLRELHVAVVDDLNEVAPGVAEVQAATGLDDRAHALQRGAHGVLVVDHEPEVAGVVGPLRPPGRERDELVADVDEGHRARASSQLQVED